MAQLSEKQIAAQIMAAYIAKADPDRLFPYSSSEAGKAREFEPIWQRILKAVAES